METSTDDWSLLESPGAQDPSSKDPRKPEVARRPEARAKKWRRIQDGHQGARRKFQAPVPSVRRHPGTELVAEGWLRKLDQATALQERVQKDQQKPRRGFRSNWGVRCKAGAGTGVGVGVRGCCPSPTGRASSPPPLGASS